MAAKWKYEKRILRDTWIRTLDSKSNLQITDAQIPGLHLRFYSGTKKKVFYLNYRLRSLNVQRNVFLGRYGEIGLDEVRTLALDYKKIISAGRDPVQERIEERRQAEKERASRIKVTDAIKLYVEKHCKIHKKTKTLKTESSWINNYIEPKIGQFYITDLTLPILTDFYNDVAAQKTFSTANHVFKLLSAFWTWCEQQGYAQLNSNPCGHVHKGKEKKKLKKTLSLDDYKKLLPAFEAGFTESQHSPRAFRALKILALTGYRTEEITKSERSDIDLENGFLSLKDSKTGAVDRKPLGKEAVEEFRKAIKEMPDGVDRIFPPTRGGPDAVIDLRKAYKWALQRAGLDFTKHELRHSYISVGTDIAGLPIQAVSKAIGHEKVSTTEIYSHLTDRTNLNTANTITALIAG